MSLNDWLEETVRSISPWTLDPHSPLISDFASLFSLVLFFFFSPFSLYSLSFDAEAVSINLINLTSGTFTWQSSHDHGSQDVANTSVHYFRLHVACARVAHKSGAATYIKEKPCEGHREGNGPLRRPFICRTFRSDRPDGKPFLIFYKTETEQ
jgi:hypothetical protein